MITRSETWGAVALSTVAIPATLAAKGWASLMSSYDVPGNVVGDPDSIPNVDSGSVPSQLIPPE
jgi:hypothetical protein